MQCNRLKLDGGAEIKKTIMSKLYQNIKRRKKISKKEF